ncbi:hypothetical protein BFL34_00027 [Clavibacter michiganensis]|uniref:Polysaccharide biosynthesis protein n=1 Tax=Clavibacter michiganensis TaxID=28447 RepID=A0A251YE40_9MICO|nr:hypothetical protein [Clavibacter michiganensis]OUE22502.1 hypothetical protein BFL34_00027 [Clavibacter michiganensis]
MPTDSVKPQGATQAKVPFMVASFTLNAATTAVLPFLILPQAIALLGEGGWASIAIGAAVGNFGAIAISLGWAITGPVHVSAADPVTRRELYVDSLRTRFAACAPVIVACALLAALIAPSRDVAALSAVVSSLAGLSAGWYYIGAGEPLALLFRVTLLTLIPALLGAHVAAMTADVRWYLHCTIAGELASLAACSFDILRRTSAPTHGRPRKPVWRVMRSQSHSISTALLAGTYVTLPLPIVGVLIPGSAPAFAAALSLLQFANVLARPATHTLQAWVPRGGRDRVHARARRALGIALAGALPYASVVGVFVFMTVPALTQQRIVTSPASAALIGATAAAIIVSQISGLVCLAALGRMRSVMTSTLVGACVGIAALPIGALLGQDEGAWAALFTAELAVTIYQVLVLRAAWKDPS